MLDSVQPPERLLPKLEQGMFAPLVRSILYQQLAGAAADAIMKRFIAACQVRYLQTGQVQGSACCGTMPLAPALMLSLHESAAK